MMPRVRSVRVLNRMNKEQAAELKIEQPRFYFRIDNGKANLRPPETAQWWHFSTSICPTATRWASSRRGTIPSPLDQITAAHMHKVRAMAAEGQYRKDARAEDWIGRAVAEVVDLDVDDKADVKIIKAALKAWFANGVLDTEDRKDENRRERANSSSPATGTRPEERKDTKMDLMTDPWRFIDMSDWDKKPVPAKINPWRERLPGCSSPQK